MEEGGKSKRNQPVLLYAYLEINSIPITSEPRKIKSVVIENGEK